MILKDKISIIDERLLELSEVISKEIARCKAEMIERFIEECENEIIEVKPPKKIAKR